MSSTLLSFGHFPLKREKIIKSEGATIRILIDKCFGHFPLIEGKCR